MALGAEAEWIKQFVAEQLVTVKTKRGFGRLEWQKLRERNEALDCRVYARAAAWIAGADRWTQAMCRNLEQQVGAPEHGEDEQAIESDVPPTSIAGILRRRYGAAQPARLPVELHALIFIGIFWARQTGPPRLAED
jgi:phage terminase large subunit GpA-like protein